MKRKWIHKETDKILPERSKNKFWPTIYCLHEKLFIGVSLVVMKFSFITKKPIYKINKDHWLSSNSKFRTGDYKIDMKNLKDGQLVTCPYCGHPVDFRLWKSSVEPNFIPIDIDTIIQKREDKLC